MTINAPLLLATLAHIEAHPETWDQDVYRCGTGMCFAGWAAELDGGRWAAPPAGRYGQYLVAREDDLAEKVMGGMIFAPWRARRVLGLDDEDLSLFASDNTLDDLRRIVAGLTEATP